MKKFTLTLFLIGIMISASSFFLGHALEIPLILRFVAPTYFSLNSAASKLENKIDIVPSDKDFPKLSELFFKVASRQNPPELLTKLTATRFTFGGAMLAVDETRAGERRSVNVDLSNGQKVPWSIEEIYTEISPLRDSALFNYSMILFILGSLVEVVAFCLEWKHSEAEQGAAANP